MGLSSSQARLLNLTARIHQIEYKAAKLEAQKLQMANDSARVYNEFLNAVDAVKIQNKTLNSDGSLKYVDSTYNNIIGKKLYDNKIYVLSETESGKVYVADKYKKAYDCSNKTIAGFLTTLDNINSNENSTYISITTAEELKALSNSAGNYRLDADIEIDDWSGIRGFSGTFDGNGHTITIKGTDGLFQSANNATIKNVNVNADINGSYYAGALISYGTNIVVENCSGSGKITTTNRIAGGLIGGLKGNCTISNSSASCEVNSLYKSDNNGVISQDFYGRCGGFLGYTNSDSNVEINDCSVINGRVNYSYWEAGGFIGQSNGITVVNRCNVDADVTVNCNGYGDSYVNSYISNNVSYDVGHYGSLFVGLVNKGSFTANNCNIKGSVSSNGNTELKAVTYVNVQTRTTAEMNNCYSDLGDMGISIIQNEKDIDETDYPNLSSDEIEEAKLIFTMLNLNKSAISIPEEYMNSSEWFTNIINSGFAILTQIDLDKNISYHISVSTDTNLQEVSDKDLLKKAEAKYEADMKRIDLKDRKYDSDIAALETERNAIKQEIDSLKTVAKDNVERTFKLFS